MKKILLALFAIGSLFLTGCAIVAYTENADISNWVFEKRTTDKLYFEKLQVGRKFVLLEDCYIVRRLPEFEWMTLLPVFFIREPDCLEPHSDLEDFELSKKELQSFEQHGRDSWLYTPPLTFSINRIKGKIPQGSILKIIGFYRSGRYLDFENGAFNYILFRDEKSGKEFYLWMHSIDDTYNKRHWIKPYCKDKTK